jgi:hypothetical protein
MLEAKIHAILPLLRDDGVVCILCTDTWSHYAKVVVDGVLGRARFVADCALESDDGVPDRSEKYLPRICTRALIYAKNPLIWRPEKLPKRHKNIKSYNRDDKDGRGPYKLQPFSFPGLGAAATRANRLGVSLHEANPNNAYPIKTPSGVLGYPPPNRIWKSRKEYQALLADNRIVFPRPDGQPKVKSYLWKVGDGDKAGTVFRSSDAVERGLTFSAGCENQSCRVPHKSLATLLCVLYKQESSVMDSSMHCPSLLVTAVKHGASTIGIGEGQNMRVSCQPAMMGACQEVGGLSYLRLMTNISFDQGRLAVFEAVREHIWRCITKEAWEAPTRYSQNQPYYIGEHQDCAIYLLLDYDVPCGVESISSVHLDYDRMEALLNECRDGPENIVVFAPRCTVGEETLLEHGISFKQIPYDLP